MKVLHVTYAYPPADGGGTEVYVAQLCRRLSDIGIQSEIAAPRRHAGEAVVDGTRVHWFESDIAGQTIEAVYGAGDPSATAAFVALLRQVKPDVVHQHAVSPACSVDLARRATAEGLPVVCTIHTPAVFCQQGAMLRWGRVPCDVAWEVAACTDCVMGALGVPAPARRLIRRMPAGVTAAVAGSRSGGAWTAARLPALMTRRLHEVDDLFRLATRTISLGPWVTALLRRNGVPDERIVEIAHGADTGDALRPVRSHRQGPTRLVYLGRLDRTKGIDLAVAAVAAQPSLNVTLDVFALGAGGAADEYQRRVMDAAGGDARIRVRPSVPHEAVQQVLAECDAVVVPSQVLETGPLVVLEAFAAGVPVIGSRLGGLAEKIRHDVDGLLVDPFDDRRAWTEAIARCVDDRDLLPRLAAGIRPPRGMADVAREMAAIYAAVTATVSPAVPA